MDIEARAKELANIYYPLDDYETVILKGKHKESWVRVAKHVNRLILDERKRIVEPLVNWKEGNKNKTGGAKWLARPEDFIMEEVLILAGVTNDHIE